MDTPGPSYQTNDSNEQLSDKSEEENPFSASGSEFIVSSNDSISDGSDNSNSLPIQKKRKRLAKNMVSQASTSRKSKVTRSSKVQKTSELSADSGFEVSKNISGSGSGKYFTITCINKLNNDREGVCKLCNRKIKMTKSNTSGLKRHLRSKHEKYYRLLYPQEKEKPKEFVRGNGKGQSQADIRTMLSPSTVTSNTSTFRGFNQIEFEELIIEWVIKKYLPFRFFEDETSTALFSFLNKEAKLPKRNALRAKISNKYSSMQEQLINYFKINNYFKISTTIDSWTSNANMSFYGITAHFIDQNWKLKSIVLDFIPALGQHAGIEIANIFNSVINKYELNQRIQGITTDSTSSNFTFAQHLSSMMENFDSKDNHFVCFSHILNLAVQDLLKIIKADSSVAEVKELDFFSTNDIDEDENYDKLTDPEIVDVNNKTSVNNIRLLALKIKRSEQIKIKFINCCKSADLTMLMPVIDVKTRWNSTLNMVNWALRMKKSLNILCENNDDLKDYHISSQDWELLSRIFDYLKVFKTLSDCLQGEKYCTLPMVVLGINMLLDKLETWAFELDECPNRNTTDEQVIEALQAARNKIVKHYSKTNWIYCVALILDPRHKTETFNLTNWGRDLKQQAISKFENLYKEVYYVNYVVTSNNDFFSTSHPCTDDNTDDFDLQSLFEKSNGNREHDWRKEIDEYCLSKRAEGNQDILEWWRKNEAIYPTLSKMARDFLSIQATSVPAERLFSKATLTISKERSRLTGESAQLLLCLNSWLCNKDIFTSV